MLSTDLLKLQDGEQVKNSYYRSPRVSPNIRKEGPDCLVVYTAEDRVEIRQLEEVILYVISEFKFAPYWLVQKWYDDVLNDAKKAFVAISSWLKVGLVWVETTPTGVYLRPTRFLLDIYNEDEVNTIKELDAALSKYINDYSFRKEIQRQINNTTVKKDCPDIIKFLIDLIIKVFTNYEDYTTRVIYISRWI